MSLYRIHCAAKKTTAQDLLDVYTRYVSWYDGMPSLLRLGSNFTPQVLFAHLYYHFSIIMIFRPFIKFRIRGSETLPRNLCLQAADAIHTHLEAYSRLYSLRRTPSFVPYLVLISSRVYVSLATSPVPPSLQPKDDRHIKEALRRNIASLDDLASCHRAGLIGGNMLRYLLKALNIYIGIREHDPFNDPSVSTLKVPDLFTSRRQVGQQCKDVPLMESSGAAPGESAALDDEEPLRSALSWPAPRQTPSMVPGASIMEETGFEESL